MVRDNSAEAIGTAWKVVGEKTILPFLTEVDSIKIAKVKMLQLIELIYFLFYYSQYEFKNQTELVKLSDQGSIREGGNSC